MYKWYWWLAMFSLILATMLTFDSNYGSIGNVLSQLELAIYFMLLAIFLVLLGIYAKLPPNN